MTCSHARGAIRFGLLALLLGCGAAAAPTPYDAGDDAAWDGAAQTDAGFDATSTDAAAMDSGSADSGNSRDASAPVDSGVVDSGIVDSGVVDSGTPDGGTPPAPSGTFEAMFTHRPTGNGRDTGVEDRITALIDAAQPGSRIRVAIFSFTRSGPADALNRAAARGVDVRILLDGGADGLGSEVSNLRTGLGASRVHLCDAPGTACVGSGIMHHKTFLFSALSDGSRNVVVQSSYNLTTAQLTGNNDGLIVRGDAALFAAYERTWRDLWADVEDPNYYHEDAGDYRSRAYFFPRDTGADPVLDAVNSVSCDATSRIRVAMAYFTDGRREVAQALATRAREGCDVRVVAGDSTIPIGTLVRSLLTTGGVVLTPYPTRSGWELHSKYMIIDAPFAGSVAHRQLVITGSENYSASALRSNDESMLRVEDAGLRPVHDELARRAQRRDSTLIARAVLMTFSGAGTRETLRPSEP